MNTSELFQHAERQGKRKSSTSQRTGKKEICKEESSISPVLTPEQEERLQKLSGVPESKIDFSDITEVTAQNGT